MSVLVPREKLILGLELEDNDAHAKTIHEYFLALLEQVWLNSGTFSGKRPFGNSSWKHVIYVALINAGYIDGQVDVYGYIEWCDDAAADSLIIDAIHAL